MPVRTQTPTTSAAISVPAPKSNAVFLIVIHVSPVNTVDHDATATFTVVLEGAIANWCPCLQYFDVLCWICVFHNERNFLIQAYPSSVLVSQRMVAVDLHSCHLTFSTQLQCRPFFANVDGFVREPQHS